MIEHPEAREAAIALAAFIGFLVTVALALYGP